jgi:hypothetical protein
VILSRPEIWPFDQALPAKKKSFLTRQVPREKRAPDGS